jgi:homogentisate 1,2-dioxygenase
MIDRQSAGVFPDKPHTVLRAPDGSIVYEEMFTRAGFAGAFSYFYHRYPTTDHLEVFASKRGWAAAKASEEGNHPLLRRLFDSNAVAPGGAFLEARLPILVNDDVTVLLARPTRTDDVYFANGDGDELWFVHEGRARLESVCGWLEVEPGDYVWVPKGLTHRWHLAGAELRALVFEFTGGVHVPRQFRNDCGQLVMDAPYTHRDFKRPAGPVHSFESELSGPSTIVAKKRGRFTESVMARSPMDVVGWDGFVYPWAFPIEKYQPKTGLVHLPPTIHGTFAAKGALVCSFVPRVLDFHPQAIPCPYPHSSVECDEIILYLRGNFTSRRGVGPGAISFHPAGTPHAPHPGAYEASIGHTKTDELAVMMDTDRPLFVTEQALALENREYHDSWKRAAT